MALPTQQSDFVSCLCSLLRSSLAFVFGAIVFVSATPTRAADVLFYAVAKDEGFNQTSAAAPTPKGSPYRFNATVGLATANSVTNATVQFLPSGTVYPLMASPYSFDFQAKFTNQAVLDAAAPNGDYQVVINAVHDGTHTITLTLTGDAYPTTTPHISNFTAAQSINPAAAFTLTWDAFSGGTIQDFVQLLIVDASGVTLFQTPDPGQTGALNGNATSVTIPANTLPASSALGGQLLMARPVSENFVRYPGVIGYAAYYKFTQFNIATTAVTNAPPPRLAVITPTTPSQFQLQLIGSAGLQYVIETSASLQSGSWTPLITNTAAGGQFNFTNNPSPTFPFRFYRGRTAN